MKLDQQQVPSPARVFVSSTSFDLSSVRQELESFLIDHGYDPLLFESAASLPALDGPSSALRHAIQCDICILIVGSRYGSRLDNSGVSFTHTEYRAARDAGKPIFAFVHNDTLVKLDLFISRNDPNFWTQEESDLFKFVHEVSGERTRFPFSSLPELKASILHQLVSYYGYLLRNFAELDMFRPTTSEQWRNLGDRFWNAAQFGQAIFCYRNGSQVDSGLEAAAALGNLARALRITGRPEEALAKCNEGITRFPNFMTFNLAKTVCLAETGLFDEALKNAIHCTEQFPNDWEAWDNLRYIYSRMENRVEAAKIAKKTLEMDPENSVLKRRMRDYENLLRKDKRD